MFQEYIAKDRVCDNFKFDFIIANEVGKTWYDNSPQQSMPERTWCISQIKPGFTVVDCGAHHGIMTTLFAMATGAAGHVYSYEALPTNALVIERNARLNNLSNITVRPVGVGASNARYTFHENLSNTMVASLAGDQAGENVIELVRLDDDIPSGVRVDFLKIDVEGHDVEAISGMKRIIAQRPIIDLEIHNFSFSDIQASLKKISEALKGYSFTVIGETFSEPRECGEIFDIEYIRQFDNPHVFCLPNSSPKSFFSRVFNKFFQT